MKSIVCALIMALALLSSAAPRPADAQIGGTSAVGSLKFISGDGLSKYVEFDARADERGTTTGGMSLSGQMEMSEQDAAAAGDPRLTGSIIDFYMKADFDCLTVNRNRAVMGGTVREASPKSYVGQRVMLVVEDSGDGYSANDRVTWILNNPATSGWVPIDAERPDDKGATLTWIATDAERADDIGVKQPRNSSLISCPDFPLASHTFVGIKYAGGDIRVQP